MADHDQQRDSVPDHCGKFIGLVADSAVVRDGDPRSLSCRFKPIFVGTIRCKVIDMPLDAQSGGGKNFRKALSKIAVREKDRIQAARS